jgi:hypothetical protein
VILTVPPRAPGLESGSPADGQDGKYAHYNALLRTYVREHPNVAMLINDLSFVCPGGVPCPAKVNGIALRPQDGTHFTHQTAPIFGRWLLPQLEAVAP